MSELQTVNTISKNLGISSRMLRYYEQIGLVESQRVEDYAYRVYDENAVKRLRQIIILRKLRVPVKQIREMFDNNDAASVIEVFERNISELDEEITALSTVKLILNNLVRELREKANVRLQLDALSGSSVFTIVDSISFPNNTILQEEANTMDLNKISEKLHQLPGVAVVNIPSFRAISSGRKKEEEIFFKKGCFIEWIGQRKHLQKEIFAGNAEFWLGNGMHDGDVDGLCHYAVAVHDDVTDADAAPYDIINVQGGLYTALHCRSESMEEMLLYPKMLEFLNNTGFEHDPTRLYMAQIIYPSTRIYKGLGHNQFQRYIPIRLKPDKSLSGTAATKKLAELENVTARNSYDIDLSTMKTHNHANATFNGAQMIVSTDCSDDGILSGMASAQWFNGAVKIEARLKINGGVRLFYHYGVLTLYLDNELTVFDISNSKEFIYPGYGTLPVNESIDIEWIIGKDALAVKVNGELRHIGKHYDYIKVLAKNPDYELCAPVRANAAFGSTVTVELLRVTEI